MSQCLSLQALPSMTMRVPGESRRHLRARHPWRRPLQCTASLNRLSRHVSISSPFPRHHAAEDVFLFLHLPLGSVLCLGASRMSKWKLQLFCKQFSRHKRYLM